LAHCEGLEPLKIESSRTKYMIVAISFLTITYLLTSTGCNLFLPGNLKVNS